MERNRQISRAGDLAVSRAGPQGVHAAGTAAGGCRDALCCTGGNCLHSSDKTLPTFGGVKAWWDPNWRVLGRFPPKL